MVIWIDMVCLALALAPSCTALHFKWLYIMLSKSYLPRRCDWKDGFFYKSPNVQSTAVDKTSFHGFFLLSSTISELGNTADWKRSLLPDPPEMYETVWWMGYSDILHANSYRISWTMSQVWQHHILFSQPSNLTPPYFEFYRLGFQV